TLTYPPPPNPLPFHSVMTPRPPRPTLFPYTTLFRSLGVRMAGPAIRAWRISGALAEAGHDVVLLTTAICEPPPAPFVVRRTTSRSEEHTSELQSQSNLVCRLLLEKKKAEC